MNILYFTTRFPFYSETFILEEIRQLEGKGHRVTVFNLDGPNDNQVGSDLEIINNSRNVLVLLKYLVIALVRFKSHWYDVETWKLIATSALKSPGFLLKYGYMLLSMDYCSHQIARQKSDLVVLHFLFKSTLAGYLISRKQVLPYHLRLHTKSSVLSSISIRTVLDHADSITAISSDALAYYSQHYQKPSIQLIRQSVNLSQMLETKSPAVLPGFKLIAIGRLVPKKGFDVLLHALHQLKTRKLSFSLNIYGDGSEFRSLTELIKQLKLGGMVNLKGKASHQDVMAELSQSDLLVVPSISTKEDEDGIPTVIPEAMALRTPVLATNVAGIPDLITDSETGWLVPSNNVEALKEVIAMAIEGKLDTQKVVVNAFDKVKKEYAVSLADELREKYKS